MAFDFGLRQIGVAVGNVSLETSQPLEIVPAREGIPQWPRLEYLVKEWQPDLLLRAALRPKRQRGRGDMTGTTRHSRWTASLRK
jgi:RNase H-fold protein (predicted Holliday junction resolvase)